MERRPYEAMRVGKNQLILTLYGDMEETWFEDHEIFMLVLKDEWNRYLVSHWRIGFICGLIGVIVGGVLFGHCPIK